MKEIRILLFPVENFTRREVEEYNEKLVTEEGLSLHLKHWNMGSEEVVLYELKEFMESCNNEEINLVNHWIAFVYITTPMLNKKTLKDLEIGDTVSCVGDNPMEITGIQMITKTSIRHDYRTEEDYRVLHLSNDRQFDSRSGVAITPPYLYYLKIND